MDYDPTQPVQAPPRRVGGSLEYWTRPTAPAAPATPPPPATTFQSSPPPAQHDLLAHALAYAALGWRVVPCHSPRWRGDAVSCSCGRGDCGSVGKHPRTSHGLSDATTDPSTIRAWWRRWPNANIALVGVGVIIDIDPRHGGDVAALGLIERDIDTPIQETGSGGHHIIYLQPSGRPPLGNGRGNLPVGIDVRGVAGYIIAAPSIHASGKRYSWVRGYEPWDLPPLELPRKLLLRIDPPRLNPPPPALLARDRWGGGAAVVAARDPQRALERAVERVRAAPDGTKHFVVRDAARELGGYSELSDEQIIEGIFGAVADRASDPHNALRTIEWGIRQGRGMPWPGPTKH